MAAVLSLWSTDHAENDIKLVSRFCSHLVVGLSALPTGRERKTRLAWEEWLALSEVWVVFFHHAEKLSKDTADSPNIDWSSIVRVQ